jgi:hypothetical protein
MEELRIRCGIDLDGVGDGGAGLGGAGDLVVVVTAGCVMVVELLP